MFDHQMFQVANPIDCFAIGDRDELAFNEDGSLTLYVQRGSPGQDKESNWLPTSRSGGLYPHLAPLLANMGSDCGTLGSAQLKRICQGSIDHWID